MRISRVMVGLIVLALVGAALAMAVHNSGRSGSTEPGVQPAALTTDNQDTPNEAPPILPPASGAELRAIDARGAAEFHSDPSASGPYSGAEMSAYGNR